MNNFAKIFLILFFGLNNLCYAQIPNFAWAKQIGGTSNDAAYGMCQDPSGNIITVGSFIGNSVDFDPGPGSYTLDANSNQSAFISKLDASGNFLWAKATSGGTNTIARSITTDLNGDNYIVGYFSGTVDFDPGPGTSFLSANLEDGFILKLTAAGVFVWVQKIGGAANGEYCQAITHDLSNNVIVTGCYGGNDVDFDGGLGTFTINPILALDIFVLKLNASGNLIWAKGLGSDGNDVGNSIDVDGTGNVYTTGQLSGSTTDFDPGLGTYTLGYQGINDVFISKLDPAGNFVYAKQIGGAGDDVSRSLKVDISGNCFVAGGFISANMDFDPGPGSFTLSSNGNLDYFILKLDGLGNFVWAKQIGGTGVDGGTAALSIDGANNLYVTGNCTGTVDLDPGVGTFTLVSNGSMDFFILKLDAIGNFVWAEQFGGISSDACRTIINDNTGNIYTSGTFAGTVDFNPGPGTYTLNSNGGAIIDAFIFKLSQCYNPSTPTLSVNSISICSGNTINLAIVSGSLNSAANWVWYNGSCGTSSFATGTTVAVTPTASANYFVRGEGNCVVAGLCTSVSVNVNSLKDITGQITSNTVFPVPGQVVLYKYKGVLLKYDSITSQNIDIAGNYTFSSISSGTYIVQVLPNSNTLQVSYGNSATHWKGAQQIIHGCTANSIKNINATPLTNPGVGPGILTGKIVEGLKYGQKGEQVVPGGPIKGVLVKCGKNPGGGSVDQTRTNSSGEYTFAALPVNGMSESYFILVDIPGLDTNGTYHVVLTNTNTTINNLDFVADSAKVNPAIFVGLKEFETKNAEIKIHPNPSNGIINFELKIKNNSEIKISVLDVYGKEVQKYYSERMNEKFQMNLGNLSEGIYFLNVVIGDERRTEKIIITK